MGNFQFLSTRNYMKRDTSSGSSTMLGPDTLRLSGYYSSSHEVTHNLGYVPLFRVYYEPFQDNKLMEAFQDTNGSLPNPPNGTRITNDGPTCLTWIDSTKLYIQLFFVDSSLSAISFPIYWVIYRDYGVEA